MSNLSIENNEHSPPQIADDDYDNDADILREILDSHPEIIATTLDEPSFDFLRKCHQANVEKKSTISEDEISTRDKSEENASDHDVNIQLKMLEMLEKQNRMLLAFQEQLDDLKSSRQVRDCPDYKGDAFIETKSIEYHNAAEYSQSLRDRLDEVRHERTDDERNGMGLAHRFHSWFANTRIYRIVADAHAADRQDNILPVNLDFHLLFKLIMLVVIFGGRTISRSMKRGSKFDQIEAYYRVATLALIALVLWSVQTGLLRIFMRVVKELTRNLERAVPGNLMGDDGRPNVHRGQRHRNLEEARNDPADERHQVESARNIHGHQLNLSDGRIEREGGLLADVYYLIFSYIFSLLPSWKPQVPTNEEDVVDAPAQEIDEPLLGE